MLDTSEGLSRVARLLKLQMLLGQNSDGIRVASMAKQCGVNRRTIYRDLITLESDLGIPIWENGGRRGILKGYYLPSINLTLKEAVSIFLMARLVKNYQHIYSRSIVSTLIKLNIVVPPPLNKHILDTIEFLEKQPRDELIISNFNKLVDAWMSHHKVKFKYKYLTEERPIVYTVSPYYIEPTLLNRSSCLIAYCDLRKSILPFKIDNIIGEVTIQPDPFELSPDFSISDHIDSEWDIYCFENIEVIKLHFSKRLKRHLIKTLGSDVNSGHQTSSSC
jgi:predicted DNA-binding transcriptional regulator YafY